MDFIIFCVFIRLSVSVQDVSKKFLADFQHHHPRKSKGVLCSEKLNYRICLKLLGGGGHYNRASIPVV